MDNRSDTTAAARSATQEPHDRARRLLVELSEALNDAFDGRFGAEVFPSKMSNPCWPLGFFHVRSHYFSWIRGRRAQNYLTRLQRMTLDERIDYHTERLRRALAMQEAAR